jgi:hypothetical protein
MQEFLRYYIKDNGIKVNLFNIGVIFLIWWFLQLIYTDFNAFALKIAKNILLFQKKALPLQSEILKLII